MLSLAEVAAAPETETVVSRQDVTRALHQGDCVQWQVADVSNGLSPSHAPTSGSRSARVRKAGALYSKFQERGRALGAMAKMIDLAFVRLLEENDRFPSLR